MRDASLRSGLHQLQANETHERCKDGNAAHKEDKGETGALGAVELGCEQCAYGDTKDDEVGGYVGERGYCYAGDAVHSGA